MRGSFEWQSFRKCRHTAGVVYGPWFANNENTAGNILGKNKCSKTVPCSRFKYTFCSLNKKYLVGCGAVGPSGRLCPNG